MLNNVLIRLSLKEKSWEYIRDNVFGKFKSKTLEKYDAYGRTGSGGGKLTEVFFVIVIYV